LSSDLPRSPSQKIIRWFAEDERRIPGITGDQNSKFLNCGDKQTCARTARIIHRTGKACAILELELKLNEREMRLKAAEIELKTKRAIGLAHNITSKVVRKAQIEAMLHFITKRKCRANAEKDGKET
jgi:hypothetical protein